MALIEIAYILFSITLIGAGIVMVVVAAQAYFETGHRSMLALVVGFTFVVAAVTATTISAFLTDFENPQLLLTVNFGVMTLGFLCIVLSLIVR